MKTNIFTFILGVCLLTNVNAQNTTTLIFKDHSGSIQMSAEKLKKEQTALKQILLKQINHSGDIVLVSFLYHNTASVSNVKKLVFNPPAPPKGTLNAIEKAKYQSALMRAKFNFINTISQALVSDAPQSRETRILEALFVISTHFNTDNKVHVMFFSDMIESSNRASIYRLTSKAQAESKAKGDVQKVMQDFGLKAIEQPDLSIDCYLPLEMMENTQALQYIPFYWQTVFKHIYHTEKLNFITL